MHEGKAYSFKKDTSDKLTTWKCSGIDDYSVNADLRSVPDGSNFLPTLNNDGRMSVSFNGNYFKQNEIVCPNNEDAVNMYIVYKLDCGRNTDFTFQNALFGAMKITEDTNDNSNNQYTGYGLCFDAHTDFSISNINNGKNVVILGFDMSFSSHQRNRENSVYVLAPGEIQGVTTVGPTSVGGSKIKGITIYAEKLYKTNFTQQNKKFVLSLHYNGNSLYLFVYGVQKLKFKAKTDQIQKNKLYVGNLSSDWTVTN